MEVCSLIIALVAVVAVIVGQILSWNIAKRQIIASTVTTSRQQWINNLRDTIADFSAKAKMIYCLARNHCANDQSIPRIEEMVQLNYKIELLVNPHEEDHAKLVRLADDIVHDIVSSLKLAKTRGQDVTSDDIDDKQNELVKLSQQILKREWKRVKSGEHSK